LIQQVINNHFKKMPSRWFKFQRGNISKQQGLRLKIEIPDGTENDEERQLTVSDICDTQKEMNIQYGSQFAEYILIGVKWVASSGGKPTPAEICPVPKSAKGTLEELLPLLQQKIQSKVSASRYVAYFCESGNC
jgi:hypothetical protein